MHHVSRRAAAALATAALVIGIPMGVALASHQFGDVPNSNPFHADIDAIADAGVTGGCGGGNYCPKANVTREQMAAFMNRLGALGPGKTPVVNADKLDGINSTGFYQYGSTAPFGARMSGAFALGGFSEAGGAAQTAISFPVPLASAPTIHIIQEGGSPPAGCSGSAASPAASPGNLCVFVGFNAGGEAVSSYDPVDGSGGASKFGAVLYAIDGVDGNTTVEVSGTWAVTAPLILVLGGNDAPAAGTGSNR